LIHPAVDPDLQMVMEDVIAKERMEADNDQVNNTERSLAY
jgi:hypothetical protein